MTETLQEKISSYFRFIYKDVSHDALIINRKDSLPTESVYIGEYLSRDHEWYYLYKCKNEFFAINTKNQIY